MAFTKGDLPYLYEDSGDWTTLHNGVEQQVGWRYEIWPTTRISVQGDEQVILVERVSRHQRYRYADYELTAYVVDEWQYLDNANTYEREMLGYRGYWEGEARREGKEALQPEVAILLSFTPDLQHVPAFIETVTTADLPALFNKIQDKYADDDYLAFHHPLPIETPKDAPDSMIDALRRMRAQTGFRVTKGRAAAVEYLMNLTGILVNNGGWQIHPQEEQRRTQLGLR
jgi:hypothetical protein